MCSMINQAVAAALLEHSHTFQHEHLRHADPLTTWPDQDELVQLCFNSWVATTRRTDPVQG